jgi:hypothetical protein
MVEAGAKPIHETTPDELWAQVGALADMFGTAGVPVTHHRLPGQMHAFFTLLMRPGHEDVIDQNAEAIDAHIAAAPSLSDRRTRASAAPGRARRRHRPPVRVRLRPGGAGAPRPGPGRAGWV